MTKRTIQWSLVSFWLATFVACGLLCLRLTFSTDYTIFFDEADPERVAFLSMEERFAQTDNFVFVVKPEQGDVFDNDTLDAIARLSERAAAIPFARRVDSLTNFPRTLDVDGELMVQPLSEPGQTHSAAEQDEMREFARTEPLLRGGVVSDDLLAAGVVVTLELPREKPSEVRDATAYARDLIEVMQQESPNLDVRLSGLAAMNDAFMGVSIDDLIVIVPLMFVGMLLLLFVLLRSASATMSVSAVVAVSSAAAMGLAGALGIPLTPPSASASTVVMTLAIADCVHVYIAARQARAEGLERLASIRAAIAETWRPVTLTSLTTIAGFLALNFAESLPLRHLGNMAAFGIAVALLASLTLFPVLLSFAPVPPAEKGRGLFSFAARAALFALERPKRSLLIGLAVTVVCAGLMTRLVSNEQFVEYFDEATPFRRDTEFLTENLTGIYGLEFVLDSGAPDGIVEPSYLRNVDSFAGWLRLQPEVRHVHAFSDLIRSAREGFDGERALPISRELAAQALLLFEMSLPAGQDLRDRIDGERRRTRLSITVDDLTTLQLHALEARTEGWLVANAPAPMHTDATSPVMIFSKLTSRNTHAMLTGNLFTLAAISIFLLLVLRRRRLAIASLLPNLAPMVMAYGLWAVAIQEIGIVAAIAGSVCLGIIVDDTIHLLSRYEYFRKQGESVDASLRSAVNAVAPALVVTSLVLSLGFGCLTLSSFQMNVHLGALSVMVILFALGADLLFLPSLILFVEKLGQKHESLSAQGISSLTFSSLNKDPDMTVQISLRAPLAPSAHHSSEGADSAASSPAQPTRSAQSSTASTTGKNWAIGKNGPIVKNTAALGALVALVLGAASLASAQDRGEAIARQVAERAGGYGDFEASLSMQTEAGGTTRELRLRAKEVDGGAHSLIIFDGPADVQGTALLSRMDGDDQQQWLYLPAARRARRIAGGQLASAFLGSEFAYEDISGIAASRYSWHLIGEGACVRGSSDRCHQLEARPRFEGSGYTRRVLHVDQDHFRVRRVEFFGNDNRLTKTLVHGEWRQHGRHWRAHRWTMTNHSTRRATVIQVGDYRFNNGFSDRDFTQNALGRTR